MNILLNFYEKLDEKDNKRGRVTSIMAERVVMRGTGAHCLEFTDTNKMLSPPIVQFKSYYSRPELPQT